MKNLKVFFLLFSLCILPCPPAFAGDKEDQIPGQVTIEHWSCKDIAELAEKYGAEKKLPESVVIEGKTCTKSELAQCLLSILDKVCEWCTREGCEAVSREDLDKIAVLHDALKSELLKSEGYLQRRQTIEKVLARPEIPPFLYKAGVNGFLRGDGVGNFRLFDFSYNPGHSEGRFLYRIKPYVYYHPTDYIDTHIEGQWYGFDGGGHDQSRFSLYQGFVEAKLPGTDLLALKAGRQEFSYGSTFILGPNSFFDGLSFDALRLRAQPLAPLTVDLLAGFYAPPFNTGRDGDIEGIYATYAFGGGDAVDGYVFRDTGSVAHHHGEHLDIWGLRGTAKLGPVSLEFEPVYESGRLFNAASSTNEDISAYGGHVDLTAEANTFGYHNKLILSYALGSGSKDAANGVTSRKEFRNPDNDTSLVGDMSVVGDLSGITLSDHRASGLNGFTLGWGVDLNNNLNFTADGHYFLANAVEDGFSRDVGLETDFTLTYSFNENFSLILEYDLFFTGRFFKDATGSCPDISYGYAMLQFNLSKSRPKRL